MKRFLITGGVLFSVLPATALDLTTLYTTTAPTNTGDCSGQAFQSNSVSMQAVYVTETCPAGYYFDVPANAAIDSTTGIVTGTSCQPCTDGYYCPSTVTVAANNGALNTQGRTQCPAGTYGNATNRGTIPSDTNDPDYNTILANYTACQACSGTTYAANTGSTSCTSVTTGWYADKVNSNDPGNTTQTQCPVGYRSVAAESQGDCTKTVNDSYCATHYPSSNFKHVATSGANAYTVVVNSNSIDENNQIAFKDRDFEPVCLVSFGCEPGYTTTNLYDWIKTHLDRIPAAHSWCSPDGTGVGCSTQAPGTFTMTITGDDSPVASLNWVSVCTNTAPSSGLAIVANFTVSDTGKYCWARNVDLPDQPWMMAGLYNSAESCAQRCGEMAGPEPSEYLMGSISNQEFNAFAGAIDTFTALASLTPGGQGNPNADVCVANTVTINWGDVADPGDAGTCTYGEDFTAPQSGPNPADHPGFKFLGWKVIPTNNNNNN